ncbi:MAG: hypothetical protein V8S34_08690, partial [Lawsonibacter sp.]
MAAQARRTGTSRPSSVTGRCASGKTLCTGLSFFCWAMQRFQNRRFALCGRTIVSVRRRSAGGAAAPAGRDGLSMQTEDVAESAGGAAGQA